MLTPKQRAKWLEPFWFWREEVERYGPDGAPNADAHLAIDAELAELVELRQQNQCLNALLRAMRDGSNAHAVNLSRLARENVELHTTLARYKAALEQYAADENWTYFISDDSFSWQRDEHPATIAAKALHEEKE